MTSDLIIDQSEKLFIVENEEDSIQFKINISSLDNNINLTSSQTIKNVLLASQTNINIRNLSKEYLSFHVKTTKKKNYIIKPCYYILSPNEILNLKLYFYIKREEPINSKGHKFKFEGFIIPKEEKDEDPKKLFLEYLAKGGKVKGTVIKKHVSFVEEGQIVQNEEDKEYDEEKKLDEFENLRVEYCKLKGINENLRMEYLNIKKMMEMELKEKNNKCIKYLQLKYDIDNSNKDPPISKSIYVICFIISIILGFILIK